MATIKQITEATDLKKLIFDEIEVYHQANWSALYPAGGSPKDWHVQGVLENVVQPLIDEIKRLKKQ